MSIIEITQCRIRRLNQIERELIYAKSGFKYKWVTTSTSTLIHDNFIIIIPKGFLTDGNSGGSDFGNAWLFHDWLYATHKIGSKDDITIQQADQLMKDILVFERAPIHSRLFSCISRCNPCCLFTSAWQVSGQRGPQFYNDFSF
jgi:hypothetical protein